MGMMGNQSNITGSVKLSTVMGNALASQIKVSEFRPFLYPGLRLNKIRSYILAYRCMIVS